MTSKIIWIESSVFHSSFVALIICKAFSVGIKDQSHVTITLELKGHTLVYNQRSIAYSHNFVIVLSEA